MTLIEWLRVGAAIVVALVLVMAIMYLGFRDSWRNL